MVRQVKRTGQGLRFATKAELLAGGADVRAGRYQRASQDKKEQGKSVHDQGVLNDADIARYGWTCEPPHQPGPDQGRTVPHGRGSAAEQQGDDFTGVERAVQREQHQQRPVPLPEPVKLGVTRLASRTLRRTVARPLSVHPRHRITSPPHRQGLERFPHAPISFSPTQCSRNALS
ncbi:hypothetical protein [Dactylosporangium sp. NPDC051541]|uniref:hypothetical protein n=1 Tax=Dactylosporangium sp. NPDC051541 TaxID=3363977 RepID=UPI0037AAF929